MNFNIDELQVIGKGGSRTVYAHPNDKNLVIKTDYVHKGFQNVLEFNVWNLAKTLPLAHWLAPVIDISNDGCMLVQERVTPLEFWDIPDWIPEFFSDTDESNFGMLHGKFVCCDYAINMMWKHGASVNLKSTYNLFTF